MSWAGVRRVVAAVAVIACVSGCGTSAPEDGVTPTADSSQADASSEAQTATTGADDEPEVAPTTPAPEDPDRTEEPQTPPKASISLDVAGLPVGGFADPLSELEHCVLIVWSGPPDIPAGVQVRATSVGLEPVGSFQVAPDLCQGRVPCLGADHPIDPSEQCVVGVRQTAPTVDGFGSLSLTEGVVTCPPDQEAVCQQFVAEVTARGPDTIEWFDAQIGTGTGDEPDSTTQDQTPGGGEPTGGDGDGSSRTG